MPKKLVLATCLLLFVGCSGGTTTPQNTVLPEIDSGASGGSNSADSLASKVTKEQALQFVDAWTQAVEQNSGAEAKRLLLFDRIVDRSLESFDLTEEFEAGVHRGVAQNNPVPRMVTQLYQETLNGGSYEAVDVVSRQGEQHAIFRVVGADGALNYHDFRIVPYENYFAADQFFVAATGEELADTLRGLVAPGLAAQSSLIGRLTGDSKKMLNDVQQIKSMMDSIRLGDQNNALSIYNKMSPDAKKAKLAQLGRIMATSVEDEENYLKALEDYAANFPNDPSLALLSIDAAYLREDSQQLYDAFEALQKWTGGDNYLKLMIGSVLCQLGDLERARAMWSEVQDEDIDSDAKHNFALGITVGLDDHAGTLKHLKILRDEFGYEFSDLRGAEGFEKFVESEEFKAWEAE